MPRYRVLSVGQCGYDQGMIGRFLKETFDAEVVACDTGRQAHEAVGRGGYELVLVNRVLDADGSSGVELIRELAGGDVVGIPAMMLVSNHAQAQREAVAAGAILGFGKGELRGSATLERLRVALGERTDEGQGRDEMPVGTSPSW